MRNLPAVSKLKVDVSSNVTIHRCKSPRFKVSAVPGVKVSAESGVKVSAASVVHTVLPGHVSECAETAQVLLR